MSNRRLPAPAKRLFRLLTCHRRLMAEYLRLQVRYQELVVASHLHGGNDLASYHRDKQIIRRRIDLTCQKADHLWRQLLALHNLPEGIRPPV